MDVPCLFFSIALCKMILPLHNYGRGNLRYYLELCCIAARVKKQMKKVIVLQLKMMIIMMEICGRSNDPKAWLL